MTFHPLSVGYYSSILLLVSTLLFGACFIGLFVMNPLHSWTQLSEYAVYCQTYDQYLKHVAQFSVIILSVSFLSIIAVLHAQDKSHQFFSQLSLQFASISTTLVSLGYFVQITSVKWNLESGNIVGLEHFVQFYPHSAILSVIMLGYTLFLGLSSLSILPNLDQTGRQRLVRTGFQLNAIACFLGFIGFVFQIIPLILFATNIGNGLAFLVLALGLIRYFSEKRRNMSFPVSAS